MCIYKSHINTYIYIYIHIYLLYLLCCAHSDQILPGTIHATYSVWKGRHGSSAKPVQRRGLQLQSNHQQIRTHMSSVQNPCWLMISSGIIEGSLEVKLPTIWTDGKAEVGRVREEKRRREKIREGNESEERRCRSAKR